MRDILKETEEKGILACLIYCKWVTGQSSLDYLEVRKSHDQFHFNTLLNLNNNVLLQNYKI